MSIGETLAQARRRAGLSVAQVSEQTRIRPLIIRGIEADDYSTSGGDFYARGNIRDIAEVVGAESRPLIEEYDRTYRDRGPVAATSLDELLDRSRPDWHRRPGVHAGLRGGGRPDRAGLRRIPDDGRPAVRPARARRGREQHRPPQPGRGRVRGPPGRGADRAGGDLTVVRPGVIAGRGALAVGDAHPGPHADVSRAGRSRTRWPWRARPRSARTAAWARATIRRTRTWPSTALRGTAWHTSWYTTPRFGNLYPGTGLIVDMGRPVTVTAVRVTLGPAAGAHFQIRVGNQPALAGHDPGRAFGRPRRGGPADAGQPGAGALRAGLVYQAAAGSRRNLQSRGLRYKR